MPTTHDTLCSLMLAIWCVEEADVTIVVAATTSGESMDRQNLTLDGGFRLATADP